jgi:hypothetical protein
MANSNQIELVVTVEVDKANQSIKSVNANLSSIEAAATKSARGAAQGIDGMTASMVKGAAAGNLLADAIKKAIDFAKEWTVEAAKEAAHAERAAAITQTLAKAHGDGAEAASKAVDAIRAVGFTAQDATTSVQKLIIADIGLEKAQGLARVAKDAAALSTEGLDSAQAFEKIMLAIETGQSRGLRTMSLFTDLQKAVQIEELKRGRTLTELEAKQVRYNAVMEAATAIQGASTAAASTFDGQMAKLGRDVKDLKEDVGRAFQGELQAVVGYLREMVTWLKGNIDLIEKFGRAAMWVAGVLATYAIASKIMEIVASVEALSAALAANPWTLLATGVVAAGVILYKEAKDISDTLEANLQKKLDDQMRAGLGSGRLKIDDLRKRGMTDDQIRELIVGRKAAPGETFENLGAGLPKIKLAGEPDVDALKLAADIRKRQAENERFFKDRAIAAAGAGETGYAKDVAEINAAIAKQTSFVDDRGASHYVALTKAAWNSIIEEAGKKLDAFKEHFALENRKALAEHLNGEDEAARKQMEFEARRYQQRLHNDADIAERNLDQLKQAYAFEEQRAGFERDARLRQVEGADAQTLAQKVAVEQQKAQIEIEYLQKVHEVKQRLYDMDTSRLLLEEELTLKRLGYRADEITARLAELSGQRQEIRAQGDEANDAAIQGARENAANRSAQLVRDQNRQIFESLRQQAGGVFDALLQKSQSVWKTIGNSLRTALLTAIKDVVTSRVAAMLMSLFTGQKVTFAGGGAGTGGGMLGGIGGLLGIGATPVFAGTGGGTFGSGPANGNPAVLSAAGGITSKSGVGILANLKQSLTGWKDLLTNLGNIGFKPERWSMDEAGNMTKLANARGVGGMKGGAMLAGGAILAMDGLRRGGKIGVAETTAGGALIGAKFGGPLGALIGGIAGFAAGMVRLFVKGAVEKAREKIKSLYGVDISDKKMLQQIVDTAKQKYGGNLDVAIRSDEIRDLIKLYAMSTGQATKGMPATVHPLDLAQSAGSLYQSPGYSNGAALPGLGGLPTLDSIGSGVASGAGPVVIQLDGAATTSLLRGEAVSAIASNPRAVATASVKAARSNAGRRELTSLQMSPGLLTA